MAKSSRLNIEYNTQKEITIIINSEEFHPILTLCYTYPALEASMPGELQWFKRTMALQSRLVAFLITYNVAFEYNCSECFGD
jgi:hypothetical protein